MINNNSFGFQGNKLKLARELKLWTISKLGSELGVSHQLVSEWENNKKKPTFEKILDIETKLGFPRQFYYTKSENTRVDNGLLYFRKGAAVAVKYQKQVEQSGILFSIVERVIGKYVNLPEFSYPQYSLRKKEFSQIDFEDIANIASSLRNEYGLGIGPVSNMTLLIEKMGIRVHFEDLSSAKIDALTLFIDGQPYIIVNNQRISSVRIRFNLAHELGHILLHSSYNKKEVANSSNHKRIEMEANFFAGSLLLPEEGFVLDLTSTNLNHLIQLKKHWKVSLQAIIYNGEQLGLISSRQVLFLRQQISRNKWRLFEPYDNVIPIEYPTLFNKAIQFVNSEKPDYMNEIAFSTGLTKEKILEMFNYDKDSYKPDSKNHLRLL
ncbi:hypothetical protein A5816_001547 [Enterococcus sp. 3G1_DIV0629]|uniref:XRE family transcriptional regulator n=1 Tax=Enterococcus sp. (strain 3G1_DIV0629) TaxID=1834176 RepID=UPI000A347E79|nr:XRE family transcriptional regulator [Enterococcus sp. 3G1_DIV0629]OTO29262.1 hypothetical protein A5816_001547 [Enterococcus sp. 3G1_DIV0629]